MALTLLTMPTHSQEIAKLRAQIEAIRAENDKLRSRIETNNFIEKRLKEQIEMLNLKPIV